MKNQDFGRFRQCHKFSKKIARSYHVGQIWLVQDGKKCFKKSQTKGFDPNTHIASCILGQLLPSRPIFRFMGAPEGLSSMENQDFADFR